MATRILIVDDEPDICEILRFNLEMEGYEVYTAEGADEGQTIVNRKLYNGQCIDLILLDVMMTHKSGFEWPSDTIVLGRTVDVNITRIRKKIGSYGECLRTKFGYGYMFSDAR